MARDGITGRTLGDFVVRDKLGEGGFGAVYRAEQPLLQREAVIKVLHRHLRASEIVIQRFLREARLASHLDHPYAAHVYAFGAESDGLLWIAMELVRGTPLDALLRAGGPLPAERLVQLLDRICEVVHTAHEQGIVHRDIKPANVIVMSRAGRVLPKLLDFGIAKLAESDLQPADEAPRTSSPRLAPQRREPTAFESTAAAIEQTAATGDLADTHAAVPERTLSSSQDTPAALTHAGSLVGSPSYMAPEQWLDASGADARADIYALGVLAYEALTGRRPFDGTTLMDIAEAHAWAPVPRVGEGHPAALDAVFARALAKRPEDRYADALELASAFRGACGLALDTRESLPQLDESLRDALLAEAPQPIAEAVAALAAAHSARQARDAVRVLVRVCARTVGLVALACRTRLGAAAGRDAEPVVQALRALRRRLFSDEEWLDLARELCRPYATTPDVFPIPELVALFFDHGTPRPSLLDDTLALASGEQTAGVSDEQVRELLARLLPGVARFLRSIAFLSDYPLVVWRGDRAELWMGLRRSKRAALAVQGKALVGGEPTLVDRAGRPILTLYPLAQVGAPSPGAPEELFLFEGKGRHGARLVALPQELERHDDTLWAWFGDTLLDTLDTAGAPLHQADAPYRGLAAFSARDAALFFGREREIDAFVNRLRTQPLIAVVGPSGAGKSSFVQAGVLPALPEGWRVVALRPGPSPLAAWQARQDELAAAMDATGATGATVLVIDQFEELFTLCHDAEQRLAFATAIAAFARSAEDPQRVILTLRDDFLVHADGLAPLRSRLAQGLQLLATPARDDLLRILTEPARAAGFDFEDRELPARMVDEVAGQPGALALLSFSAAKLWELRDRHFKQLGRKAYEAMGGVGGALAGHAEAMLAALSVDEQRLVREAFRNLVTAEGTRAVLSRRELLEVLGTGSRAASVIERLVTARLLVAAEGEGGEERIEIIHEALLVAWPRLVRWRREDAEGARLRDQLRSAARQWAEHGRTRGLLWRDEALTEYQLWRARHPGALTESETAFAHASLAEAARGRRVRRGVLGLAFVGLVGVAIALTIFNREARQQTAEAKRQIIKLYTEQGRRALLDGYRQRALVYLAAAWHLGGRDPALEFLVKRAGTALDQQVAKLAGHTAWVRDARFSTDGKLVVTISDDRTARLWNATTGQMLHVLAGHTDWVRGVVFAPDDRSVMTTSWDGTARSWDVETGRQRWRVDLRAPAVPTTNPKHEMRLLSLPCVAEVSPDGERFVAGCMDRRTAIVRRDGTVERWIDDHASLVRAASISPDGRRLVVVELEHPPRIVDLATGVRVAELVGHEGRVIGARFSADGNRVLTVGSDGAARTWAATDGAAVAELRGHEGTVWAGRLSADNTRAITAGLDGTLRIWDARGHALDVVRPTEYPIFALDVDRDARHIFSGDDAGLGVLSDGEGRRLAVFEGHATKVWSARFSHDQTRLVTASGDATARVWRIEGDRRDQLAEHRGSITGVRALRDGTLLSSSEDGSVRRWDPATGHAQLVMQLDRPILALAVDRAERRAALGTVNGTVEIVELATGRRVHVMRGHAGRINALAFAPAGQLASVGDDGRAMLWDPARGTELGAIAASKQALYAVTFDDAGRLVTGGEDATVRLWEVATRTERRAIPMDASIQQIAFCGEQLLVASGAKIHVSSIAGASQRIIAGQGDTIMAVSCARQIVTSAGGGEVRISALASGELLERVEIAEPNAFALDVSPGGEIWVGGPTGVLAGVALASDPRPPAAIVEAFTREGTLELSKEGAIRARK